MFGFLRRKPLLSETDRDFQIETYRWLLRNFGGEDFYQHTQLVLPTSEFFPLSVSTADEVAEATFMTVKALANMQNWHCELEKQEKDIDPRVAETVALQNVPSSPHGTFSVDSEQKVVITYNPQLVNNPQQLVATFAHELAHYLTATTKEAPPGGFDNWEFATDIAAIFLGFGIFMANTAFTFHQYSGASSQGWRSQRSGYLSDTEYAYSLAIFTLLKDIPTDAALSHLKATPKSLYKKCLREIKSLGFVEDLKKIELVHYSSDK
ncbi:hypothetical protein [Aliikangiella coralliicola]|uniref:IrrE N-terminal-like domain-containing protein n=1 Tax=Aliikangiella coralliicola TaxID=2592383 RepID=A0A545U7E3_9GAMM|nr:hypothetical protein [Aliikangiella coralliicola]TQV85381.1 hypothetical protein FLL46_19640 [Aliikangiella coralliicola]